MARKRGSKGSRGRRLSGRERGRRARAKVLAYLRSEYGCDWEFDGEGWSSEDGHRAVLVEGKDEQGKRCLVVRVEDRRHDGFPISRLVRRYRKEEDDAP